MLIKIDPILDLIASQVADRTTREAIRRQERRHHEARLVDSEADICIQALPKVLNLASKSFYSESECTPVQIQQLPGPQVWERENAYLRVSELHGRDGERKFLANLICAPEK